MHAAGTPADVALVCGGRWIWKGEGQDASVLTFLEDGRVDRGARPSARFWAAQGGAVVLLDDELAAGARLEYRADRDALVDPTRPGITLTRYDRRPAYSVRA